LVCLLAGYGSKTLAVPRAKLCPRVAILGKRLVQLVQPPDVALLVLLVLGVNGVELSRCARLTKERRVKERGESCQSTRKTVGRDVEVVVGVVG
jgi:hypothetical protein